MVLTLWAAGLGTYGQTSPLDPPSSISFTMRTICNQTDAISATLTAHSMIECARQCFNRANCIGFCFSRRSGRCYVRVADTSSVTSVEASEGSPVDLSSVLCSARCPESLGYAYVSGQCVKAYSLAFKYDEAKRQCSQDGSHLHHFKSRQMDFPVVQNVVQAAGFTAKVMWTGADSLTTGGRFQWSDGCPLDDNQTVWSKPIEPSRYAGESCVELYLDNGYLNDIGCFFYKPFVCQFALLGSCAVCL